MTKRSGRSRKSKRRSGTDRPISTGDTTNDSPTSSVDSAEERLRAEAERRADQAMSDIVRDDDKAEEDRRILRENGNAASPAPSGDSGNGDAGVDGAEATAATPSDGRRGDRLETPETRSSDLPVQTGGHHDSAGTPRQDGSATGDAAVVSSDDAATGDGGATSEGSADPADRSTVDAADTPSDMTVTDSDPLPVTRDQITDGADTGARETDPAPARAQEPTTTPAEEDRPGSVGTGGTVVSAAPATVPEYLRAPEEPEDHNPSRGWVRISEKTVTKIVRQAAASVPGTTDQVSGGIDVLGRGYPRFDVELDSNGDAVSIDAYIAVTWPSPVTRVAETVRTTIFDWVRDMTDIPVVRVNVTVGPIVQGTERVTDTQLRDFDTTPRLRPVVVTARNAALDEITCVSRNSELTEFSVTPGSENLRPVTVTGPDNANLRSIETVGSTGEDLSPVVVTEPADLREVTVTGEAAARVFSPEVSPAAPLGTVTVAESRPLSAFTVADPQPLSGITVPEPAPLKPISARELPTVEVAVPAAAEPTSVTAPSPAPLRKVEAPEPVRLRSVHAPDTHRLAQVHADAPRVSPVKAPRPPRLKPVKRNPVSVDRKPRVDRRPTSHEASTAGERRQVTVTPAKLRPITVKPTTIIPVRVDPANAKGGIKR
ncbi:Asp23/Gls24 family envelope stress response protein [Corynebacterium pygosceleis]|uniref:Asp23/Gls24 family envelope stress response protein n=1 Tax=Corynebacterium pygosceleis TaxID=2800406 RepID=A0A9Q4GI89_9CORY|nr:Asp23/Gls24 family envelope stress response protein [Corynebacterium pygosceleis]MCK7637503.1 Asp23/Gls24 family envelope stress response protein [Corynebacterium pygosceleis]MCK7674690.1 Asp23/Gls24 family envelope stress response protein [Corynebacterium pygosceleis]MCL0119721.1 Asp23/Gls24 family envelope stress response protein [Corynebacterium pygosceleis]MCX7468168.1 Asp23/Gls24 family envelope stress response protein [Corynebacterium pygosceleis]